VDPIIVGQAAYNSAYGTNFVANGWCNAPGATGEAAKNCDGYARIAEGSQPTDLFGFNALSAANAPGVGKLQIPFQPKGIHDEMNSASFDEWGRMTANMGLEAPGATPLLQNIILYPYVNPVTEILNSTLLPSSLDVTPISSAADGTQIWKITHNGVDTHPIHFHLYDVQVINRVTWDNIIIPPEPTELGWKDTVRVSPLEDTIVAVRPIVPTLPFGVPDSKRPYNPMMPIGAKGSVNGPLGTEAGFNNTDANGNPIAPIVNQVANFDWEYVFHCHILSHEEMDMMRPVTVFAARALPAAPVVTYTRNGGVSLTWTDGTPVAADAGPTWGNPKNEVGYRIERAPVANNGNPGAYAQIGTALANQTTFSDSSAGSTTRYSYRVTAFNAAGNSVSTAVLVGPIGVPLPAAPTLVTGVLQAGPQISLTFRDNATNETGFVVERASDGVTFIPVGTPPLRNNTGNVTFVDATIVPSTTAATYTYRVKAVNGAGSSAYASIAVPVVVPAFPTAPSNLSAVPSLGSGNNRTVSLSWTDNSTNETGFTFQRATNAAFTTGLNTATAAANSTTLVQTGLSRNTDYYYRIRAINLGGSSAWVNATPFPVHTAP